MKSEFVSSVKLDWTRLLGFDQVLDRRDLVRGAARLSGKIGDKGGLKNLIMPALGAKIGEKGGVKGF
jgi:hypothetical protein